MKIDISQNYVIKEGMIYMIEAFKNNPCLETICIQDNWLKEEAIEEFWIYLSVYAKKVISINISDCAIGDVGVQEIMESLDKSQCKHILEEFFMDYNDIERSKTFWDIFDVLSTWSNLKTSSLIGNNIRSQLKKFAIKEFRKYGVNIVFDHDYSEEGISCEEDENYDQITVDMKEGNYTSPPRSYVDLLNDGFL